MMSQVCAGQVRWLLTLPRGVFQLRLCSYLQPLSMLMLHSAGDCMLLNQTPTVLQKQSTCWQMLPSEVHHFRSAVALDADRAWESRWVLLTGHVALHVHESMRHESARRQMLLPDQTWSALLFSLTGVALVADTAWEGKCCLVTSEIPKWKLFGRSKPGQVCPDMKCIILVTAVGLAADRAWEDQCYLLHKVHHFHVWLYSVALMQTEREKANAVSWHLKSWNAISRKLVGRKNQGEVCPDMKCIILVTDFLVLPWWQTEREKANAVDMHTTFQQELVKLRLATAKAYMKVMTDGQVSLPRYICACLLLLRHKTCFMSPKKEGRTKFLPVYWGLITGKNWPDHNKREDCSFWHWCKDDPRTRFRKLSLCFSGVPKQDQVISIRVLCGMSTCRNNCWSQSRSRICD